MSLLAEPKRRHVFKVGGAYVVIAWLLVQVASIAFPAFEAPPWVLRVFILMLMPGLPLALVMAWKLVEYGFVACWREKGWPAVCRPLGDGDFECGIDRAKPP